MWKQLQWATALIMNRFRRDLAAAGLSLEQFDVLVHLAWAPSGTLPLHELTASMVVADALSRSGITRLLDRMERDGLDHPDGQHHRPPPVRRLAHPARAPAVRAGLARPRRRDRPLLRPAPDPPRHRRTRQDPGQPDPGQPEPRPARLTPAARQRCAPGATPGNPGHAHQREHPARSRPRGGPGRELAVLTAIFTIRAPGPAAGEPALSPCLAPAAPGAAQINRSRVAPVMVNGARSADPNGGSARVLLELLDH